MMRQKPGEYEVGAQIKSSFSGVERFSTAAGSQLELGFAIVVKLTGLAKVATAEVERAMLWPNLLNASYFH